MTTATILLALLTASPSHAAGPWLVETGGSDTGMAGAGRAAMSLDASALASNPASIAGLEGSTISLAAMPLELRYDFRGFADGTTATASNQDGPRLIPAMYAVHHGDHVSAGLGLYSPLGLAFDSGNRWQGRRVIEQAGIASLNVMAVAAWQASGQLRVGAAVGAQWLRPEARVAVANDAILYGPPAGLPDGHVTLRGDSWSPVAQVGATFELTETARAGIAWTTPVDHDSAFDRQARGLHPALAQAFPPDGAARLEATVPQQLLLGVTRESGETMFALGLSWQRWSRFGTAKLSLPGYAAPMFEHGLRDSWGASAGLRHDFSHEWSGSAGISFESDPAPAEGVPAYFPAAEQWRLAGGLERSCGDGLRLRAAVSLVLQGDARVVQDTHPLPLPGIPVLRGQYRDTRVVLLVLGADFRL